MRPLFSVGLIFAFIFTVSLSFAFKAQAQTHTPEVNWGNFSTQQMATWTHQSANRSLEDRINWASSRFLNTPYQSNTLDHTPESLVVNFAGVDCMTLVEYTLALAKIRDQRDFFSVLKQVRYYDKEVSYQDRKHFFNDWLNSGLVVDVTERVALRKGGVKQTQKSLNRRTKQQLWLKNVPVREVSIHHLDPDNIDFTKVRTGDLVGIYSSKKGLDVSHLGIIIKKNSQTLFRHASLNQKKVVDVPLDRYLKKRRKDIVVYRVLP